MKKNQIKVGGLYTAKVSDKLVTVRIDSAHTSGGWNATNTATGKRIRIKSAQRLRGAAKGGAKAETTKAPEPAAAKNAKATATAKVAAKGGAKAETTKAPEPAASKDLKDAKAKVAGTKSKKASGEKKPKRVSALDAAAQVLKSAGRPMRAQELITAMAEQNLWKSPGGKTPHATLYAAMLREGRDKGKAARFTKVDRGQFAFNKESK
jgi:hypothetical protein